MGTITSASSAGLQHAIAADGFVYVKSGAMRDLFAAHGTLADWAAFTDSWNALGLDTYMADGGRYRRRRYAAYEVTGGTIARKPHQPHFQAIDYNPLNGGIARWFEPIDADVGRGASMTAILGFCQALFDSLAPRTPAWQIEVHQFRIEARRGEEGRPTPEGLHRDGVDYVLVLLVDRRNIASGMTRIHALDGTPLGHFTLTDPFDSALVDDTRVAHGVTPVEPIDPQQPAYRDVLVVTFKKTVMRNW